MKRFSVDPVEQVRSEVSKHSSKEKRDTTGQDRNRSARLHRIELLKKHFPTAKRILCVGARADSEVQDFIDAGFEAQGIDLALNSDLVRQVDAHVLNEHFDDYSYDVAYCCHSLEHMYDAPRVLENVRRVAIQGVVLTLPHGANAITPNITHPCVYDIMIDCPKTMAELRKQKHLLRDFRPFQPYNLLHFERAKDYAEFNMVFRWNTETYQEHYQKSQANYRQNTKTESLGQLASFDVEIIPPSQKGECLHSSDAFLSANEELSRQVASRLNDPQHRWLPSDVSPQNDFAQRLADIHDLPALENVAEHLVPELEARLYGSYLNIEGVYIYRSIPAQSALRSSWIWHYDNNPREMVKVMIYLNDVTEKNAPFQFLRHKETGRAVKIEPQRVDYTKWRTCHSRISDDEVETYSKHGYEPHSVVGPRGTVVVFDNNIIHRATVAQEGHRDVAVLLVRPATRKLRPLIDPRSTGTYGDKSLFIDPGHVSIKRDCPSRPQPRRPFFLSFFSPQFEAKALQEL